MPSLEQLTTAANLTTDNDLHAPSILL